MSSKDLIREQILEAGLRLVNKFGYGSLTLSELARQSKITKQRLYYHFPTPEEILIVLAERWSLTGQQCTLEALAQTREQGCMKVLAMSEGMFRWMEKHEELSKMGLVLYQSSPYIKKLSHFMDTAREAGRNRIKSLLTQDEVFAHLSKGKMDSAITAIHSHMYGYFFYIVAMNDFKNLRKHEQSCQESLRKLILSILEDLKS